MEENTVKLLEEIQLGCFMAENTFDQLEEYELRESLEELLQKYRKKHGEIRKEASELLHQHGEQDKKPGPMAEAMSWITTEMRMMGKNNGAQAAKLMMNGCNMGIQTISEKLNDMPDASKEAQALGRKLIKMEEELMAEMKQFL